MGTSKNQRRAAVGGKGGFERAAGSLRIIPTGQGRFAYVLTPSGRTVHVKVGSPEFVAAVAELRDAEDRFFEAELASHIETFAGLGWESGLASEEASEAAE